MFIIPFRWQPVRLRFAWVIPALLWAAGCASPGAQSHAASRLVDLTHPFDEHTIYWPASKPFHMEIVHKGPTRGGYWYEANNFETAEHGGTHLDAPAHFAEGRWTVDQIPLERLVAPGVLVDLSNKALKDPDYRFSARDFMDWESRHGAIEPGSIVLVRTGYETFWPDKLRYLGSNTPGDTAHLHFPGFGEDAARFLAEQRRVAAVGLDTASLDPGPSADFIAHRVFGRANVIGFENLHRLSELPARGFRVIALPMKIGGGSGGPLRIVAEIF